MFLVWHKRNGKHRVSSVKETRLETDDPAADRINTSTAAFAKEDITSEGHA